MQQLFNFTGEHPSKPWGATNDGVMGGLSAGGAQLVDEGMLFSGVLSLENNGGFSSVHADGNYDLADYDGIRFRVRGDGRTYQLRLQSDAVYRGWGKVNFGQEFETVEGEWIEVFIPFDELKPSWRGRQLSGYTLNTAHVRRIGFMLADKQTGPFSLTAHWLAATAN